MTAMPLRYLLDENQRGVLWQVIECHNARGIDVLDALRVGDPPDLPLGSDDATILLWAEREQRILVTFDRSSMSLYLSDHLKTGNHSPRDFHDPGRGQAASSARVFSGRRSRQRADRLARLDLVRGVTRSSDRRTLRGSQPARRPAAVRRASSQWWRRSSFGVLGRKNGGGDGLPLRVGNVN